MDKIIFILILAAALEQAFIMVLEMFLINSPMAKRTFQTEEALLEKKQVRVMFANQGLYNGFLAAGLFWSLFAKAETALQLKFFFLGCVIVAAIYGAATANKKIIVKQGGIAIIAMVLMLITSFT